MSEENNNAAAPTEPKPLLPGQYAEPANLRQHKINDTIEDVAAAEAKVVAAQKRVETLVEKLAELRNEEENGAKYDAIKVGDTVSYIFGRGDKKRTLSGVVMAMGEDGGTVKLLVQSGEGLDITNNKIDRSTVVFQPAGDVVESDPIEDALSGTV